MTENDTARERRELEMAARALIELFGEDAPKKALERATEYRAKGEESGEQFWLSLAEVICEASGHRPPSSAH